MFWEELNKTNTKFFIWNKTFQIKDKYSKFSIFLALSQKYHHSFFAAQSWPETFIIYTTVSYRLTGEETFRDFAEFWLKFVNVIFIYIYVQTIQRRSKVQTEIHGIANIVSLQCINMKLGATRYKKKDKGKTAANFSCYFGRKVFFLLLLLFNKTWSTLRVMICFSFRQDHSSRTKELDYF